MSTTRPRQITSPVACLGVVLAVGVIMIGLSSCDRHSQETQAEKARDSENEFQRKLAAIPDPFREGAIIYTYSGADENRPIPVSENLADADEDMRRQHEMHRAEFESLASEYLQKPHEARKPIHQLYYEYVEEAARQGHLLLLPEGVQMRILGKIREGDPPATSIFHCEVLDGQHRGKRIYLQKRYLTAHSEPTPSA